MITNWKSTILAIALIFSVAAVLVLSSCGGDDEPEPEPIVPPGLSYTPTTVAVGSTGTVTPAVQGDAATYSITDDGDAAFITIDATTGVLSVAAESTTGVYTVSVKATNSAGSDEATVDITIGINPDFDPTGKELYWKYFMNNTAGITLLNLNELDDNLPPTFPLPVEWPGGTPFVIDPLTEGIESYFVFTGIQEAILQVPGDDACLAYVESGEDSVYHGDTLIVIVNQDLTLSTVCRKKSDKNTTVITEIGNSTISYANDGFVWTINVVLQGVLPLQISIADATIVADYIDPLYPNWSNPSGTGGMYDAITGNVAQYQTVDDYGFLATGGLPTGFIYLDVDVVLEIMN